LDLPSRNALWEMIRELVSEGTTVLLTTQYLEEADQLADRIAVVDEGRVVADDTPAALKAKLGGTVIELEMPNERAASRAARLVAGLVDGIPERDGAIVRLTSDDGTSMLMEVLRTLDAKRLAPSKLAVREPSLDDVFLAKTGRSLEGAGDEEEEERGTGEVSTELA
jgi:ABC-type multidrug transport system ATPase subunit